MFSVQDGMSQSVSQPVSQRGKEGGPFAAALSWSGANRGRLTRSGWLNPGELLLGGRPILESSGVFMAPTNQEGCSQFGRGEECCWVVVGGSVLLLCAAPASIVPPLRHPAIQRGEALPTCPSSYQPVAFAPNRLTLAADALARAKGAKFSMPNPPLPS